MKINPGDLHYVWSRKTERVKCFKSDGKEAWRAEMRNRVVRGHKPWPNGDWEMGDPVNVRQQFREYGLAYIPFLSGEPLERGLYVHSGGTGSRGARVPRQGWIRTQGCMRLQNEDAARMVADVRSCKAAGGRSWLTVGP